MAENIDWGGATLVFERSQVYRQRLETSCDTLHRPSGITKDAEKRRRNWKDCAMATISKRIRLGRISCTRERHSNRRRIIGGRCGSPRRTGTVFNVRARAISHVERGCYHIQTSWDLGSAGIAAGDWSVYV